MSYQRLRHLLVVVMAVTRRFRRRGSLSLRIAAMTAAVGATGCIADRSFICDPTSPHCADVIDDDGDGVPKEEDCDDHDPTVGSPDEHGVCESFSCDHPDVICNWLRDDDGDGFDHSEDCNDQEPLIYPGAHLPDDHVLLERLRQYTDEDERVDYDCDGELEAVYWVTVNHFPDMDGDGFEVPDDCNDSDPLIFPGAAYPVDSAAARTLNERYGDLVDYNCDGDSETVAVIGNPLPDSDGDGFLDDVDCEPTNPLIYPGADHSDDPESLRALERQCVWDYNCDDEEDMVVFTNCFPDVDGDGFTQGEWDGPVDCDDRDPLIYPEASYTPEDEEWPAIIERCEQSGGELDYNCDGLIDVDCTVILNG